MKRKSHRSQPRTLDPDRYERLFKDIFGLGPRTGDIIDRSCQARRQLAMGPLLLPILLGLELFCLALVLWERLDEAIEDSPLGRILHASRATRRRLLKQRRRSTRGAPTPEALAAAWAKSRKSLEWRLRLGSMLEDLEPVVDQSYIRDEDGVIVGREPGIRGWLFDHCQVVSEHYKTAMGYKALAHRFRLAIGLPEPFTLEDVLDALTETIESIEDKDKARRDVRNGKFKNSDGVRKASSGVETAATTVKAGSEGTDEGGVATKVETAKKNAERMLQNLRIRNRNDGVAKGGRVMWRATWVLDELLHDRLKLLRRPRSA